MLKSYLEFCCKGFIAPQVLGRRHTSTKNVSGLSLLVVTRQIDCLWKSSGPRNAIRCSHRKQCWIGQRKHAYSQSNWASWWWNFEADPIRLLGVNHFGKQNSGSGWWKFVKLKRTQISLRARKQRKKTNWLQSSWIKVHFEKRRGMKWRTEFHCCGGYGGGALFLMSRGFSPPCYGFLGFTERYQSCGLWRVSFRHCQIHKEEDRFWFWVKTQESITWVSFCQRTPTSSSSSSSSYCENACFTILGLNPILITKTLIQTEIGPTLRTCLYWA